MHTSCCPEDSLKCHSTNIRLKDMVWSHWSCAPYHNASHGDMAEHCIWRFQRYQKMQYIQMTSNKMCYICCTVFIRSQSWKNMQTWWSLLSWVVFISVKLFSVKYKNKIKLRKFGIFIFLRISDDNFFFILISENSSNYAIVNIWN